MVPGAFLGLAPISQLLSLLDQMEDSLRQVFEEVVGNGLVARFAALLNLVGWICLCRHRSEVELLCRWQCVCNIRFVLELPGVKLLDDSCCLTKITCTFTHA